MGSASFWGDPSYEPEDHDVVRFLEAIRKMTSRQSRQRALKIATSAMHAITAYVATTFSQREALSLLDALRNEILGVA